jgi:hypothetical protein
MNIHKHAFHNVQVMSDRLTSRLCSIFPTNSDILEGYFESEVEKCKKTQGMITVSAQDTFHIGARIVSSVCPSRRFLQPSYLV